MSDRDEYDFALKSIHSLSDLHDNNGRRICYCCYSDTGHSVDQYTSICIAVEVFTLKWVLETDYSRNMSFSSLKVRLSSAIPSNQLTTSLYFKYPQRLFNPSANVGCANTASLNLHHGTPPIIATCTKLMTSPPSIPKHVNPRISPLAPSTTAFINPLVSAVSTALAT
jgi:hypothetical protein